MYPPFFNYCLPSQGATVHFSLLTEVTNFPASSFSLTRSTKRDPGCFHGTNTWSLTKTR